MSDLHLVSCQFRALRSCWEQFPLSPHCWPLVTLAVLAAREQAQDRRARTDFRCHLQLTIILI